MQHIHNNNCRWDSELGWACSPTALERRIQELENAVAFNEREAVRYAGLLGQAHAKILTLESRG